MNNLLHSITQAFQQAALEHPRRQAEELLCQFFHCSRADLFTCTVKLEDPTVIAMIQSWVVQRSQGTPLAYISGTMDFYHCFLKITPDVLIPRPETEILVDKIVSHLKNEDLQGKELWDLCCGSGCIGIAIKKALPALRVVLSDISEKAIQLAKLNAHNNQVEVECVCGDLFVPFEGKRANYIVSNPPYISKKDFLSLDKEVKNHEPALALIGGDTGLEFYERFARELPSYLKSGGKCWFEMGYDQGEALKNLFKDSFYKKTLSENDWAGHNRFFFLEIE